MCRVCVWCRDVTCQCLVSCCHAVRVSNATQHAWPYVVYIKALVVMAFLFLEAYTRTHKHDAVLGTLGPDAVLGKGRPMPC